MRRRTEDNLVKWGFLREIFDYCFIRRCIEIEDETVVLVYDCPLCGKEFIDVDNQTFFEFEKKCREHLDKCYWHGKKPITMKYIFTKKKIAKMKISYND